MIQYIELAALLAEIESYKNSFCDRNGYLEDSETNGLTYDTLCELEDSINALEVKEVDLEKETKKWWKEHLHLNPENKLWMDAHQSVVFAKHFFELGIQAQSDEKLVEEIYSHLDGIKDTIDRMTSGNFMHNKATIKFSADTIAKVLELMGLKIEKGE